MTHGFANYPLPHFPYLFYRSAAYETGLDSDQVWSVVGPAKFLCRHAAAAIDLMEWCGFARNQFSEIWAEVYVNGRQVGWIWMYRILDGDTDSIAVPGSGNASVAEG